ncbi:kanamycin kinase [Microbacterium sp. AG1240]|uniref:aminoglycoside 3'-phosphotransferase n=1 Tax=Microbacterium sp. AG1240 TaxID=2183992 RepID=UPI000EAD662D|nr:aminoglycoside 3'-phosphotransferase [Microbacterium sp. AG1240]RKT35615.1 kanamycin kinase [Microbacterium sp. AG1240]
MVDDEYAAWVRTFTPGPETAVPDRVARLAGGATLEPVWRNGIGGLTFRATEAGSIRYIKYAPRTLESSMGAEAERMRWAAPFTPVPRVLSHGCDDEHEWLVTAALHGRSAVDPLWVERPGDAVRAIGAGLRALHDALPVDTCPFDWGVEARVATAAARGIEVPPSLRTAPTADRLVVCHGDACAPNTLIGDDGSWSGHVDLGALGVADRWADIAVAAMSTVWNYGPGWTDELLAAYGVEPDPARLEFYRDLWNAT